MLRTISSSLTARIASAAMAVAVIAGLVSCGGGNSSETSGTSRTSADTGGWTLVDLGVLNSPNGFSIATGINDKGEIVGASTLGDTKLGDASSDMHAFLYKDGTMTDLGTLLDGKFSIAYAINNNSIIVGQAEAVSYDAGSSTFQTYGTAFFWDPDEPYLQSLSVPSGTVNAAAFDINLNGDIVGTYRLTGTETYIAFLASKVGPVEGPVYHLVSTQGTVITGSANAINDKGQIAVDSGKRAYLYENGKTTDLGELQAQFRGLGTHAAGINSKGHIVGSSNGVAFVYIDGIMTTLGRIQGLGDLGMGQGEGDSTANSINDSGQIVGSWFVHSGDKEPIAFLFGAPLTGGNEESLIDLNSLPEVKAAGWRLKIAYKINNKGQIVGEGVDKQGRVRAFLLIPPLAESP